jgi:pimeloyl-ACP methyl ester carboxylesterase
MKPLYFAIAVGVNIIIRNIGFSQTNKISAAKGREEYIQVEKNVRLHIVDLGDGIPIILIHGWPLSNAMYEYQYQYLIRKGFRVLGISLRGFGKSDKPAGRYDFDVFSDDIKKVLKKLKIKNAVLGGFSMGGAVSLHYLIKYKAAHISKLALFGAAAPSWIQRSDFPYGTSEEAANEIIHLLMTNRPQQIENIGKMFAATENSLSYLMARWIESLNMEASPYATIESFQALMEFDFRKDLKKITLPVAIFHGKKDRLCDFNLAEELHKEFPNSYIVPFEKSGHALFLEEMEKFNLELEIFARK